MPPPSSLPPELRGRPFLVREALALGVTPRRLRAGDLRAPHRQVRVEVALPWTLELRCHCARLVLPAAAVLSGSTAVALLHLPAPLGGPREVEDPEDEPLAVAVPTRVPRPRVDGVRVRAAPLPAGARVLRRGGLPVLAPADVWAERCGDLDRVEAVALGDAVRRRSAGVPGMFAAAVALPGRAAQDRALDVLFRVRHRVDSPMETRLRLLLVDSGVPEPLCGEPLLDGGHPVAWPDLSWPAVRVAVEYDGAHHVERRQAQRDRARARTYRERGWELVVVGSDGVLVRPGTTAAHVERVLRDRGLHW